MTCPLRLSRAPLLRARLVLLLLLSLLSPCAHGQTSSMTSSMTSTKTTSASQSPGPLAALPSLSAPGFAPTRAVLLDLRLFGGPAVVAALRAPPALSALCVSVAAYVGVPPQQVQVLSLADRGDAAAPSPARRDDASLFLTLRIVCGVRASGAGMQQVLARASGTDALAAAVTPSLSEALLDAMGSSATSSFTLAVGASRAATLEGLPLPTLPDSISMDSLIGGSCAAALLLLGTVALAATLSSRRWLAQARGK